jgi:hypothetical protein
MVGTTFKYVWPTVKVGTTFKYVWPTIKVGTTETRHAGVSEYFCFT